MASLNKGDGKTLKGQEKALILLTIILRSDMRDKLDCWPSDAE